MPRRTTRTRLGPHFNEGARLCWVEVERLPDGQEGLRRRMKGRGGKPLSNGQVNSWLYGDSRPGRDAARQLHALFGVPIGAWDESPKESFMLPAARHVDDIARA